MNDLKYTLADFERWLAQLAATGLTPVNQSEVERVRAALKAGGTMTVPVQTYPNG